MSVQTGADIPHDVFGGILTEVGPSNMPSGGSPANLNVEYLPGLLRTRGGLQVEESFTVANGPYQARYTKSYGQVPESQAQLVLLVNPTTNAQGIVAIAPGTIVGSVFGYGGKQPWSPYAVNPGWAGPFAKSSTQFGREYIAISEGRYGYDLPRQWDGTYYDRVSKYGPGKAPSIADGDFPAGYPIVASPSGLIQISVAIINITVVDGVATVALAAVQFLNTLVAPLDSFSISGSGHSAYDGTQVSISQGTYGTIQFATTETATGTGGTVVLSLALVQLGPVTPAQSLQFVAGTNCKISGATNATWDGIWPIRAGQNPTPTTSGNIQIIISVTVGLSASGGGTIQPPSQIVAGLRQMSVCFIYRNGYITRPAPPVSWQTAGYLLGNVTNIPTGPSAVIGRLLIFTPYLTPPATTGTFYSIRQTDSAISTVMQINDNTTTSLSVNFADSDLLSGFSAQYLFGLRVLGECSFTFPYAGRMFYGGELNNNQQLLNLDFNGGWSLGTGLGGSDVPLGWTNDGADGAGGHRLAGLGVWQDAYQMVGNGSLSAMITQSAFQDFLKVPILSPSTSYSARFTAASTDSGALLLTLDIYSASGGGQLAAAAYFVGGATFTTTILPFNFLTPAVIPSDAVIRLYVLGPAAQSVTLDRIEIYPTNQPITYTGLWASYVADPESIDGVTGLVQPIYSNGEAVRTCYTLRDSMYIACDRSTFVTKDVAGSEPALWTVDPVSSTIGTTNPNGVAAGEDWEVKVNRYGLYIYLGREPEKLSQEIQTLWNKSGSASQINWTYGYKIWATVDLQNKRIYIGAPINGATECNTLFVMDYNTLDTSEMIAQYPTLRFSPYTGRRVILEQGRKWTQWQFNAPGGGLLPLPCGAFIEKSDGTAEFVLGGGADNNVYFIDPTNRGNDNGQPVSSFYTSHFFPTQDEEQSIQAQSGPLRSHMHNFSFLRKYVQGFGKLAVSVYENTLAAISNTNPRTLGSIDLQNPAPIDAELTFDDSKAERWAISWQTNALNHWWQVERVTRVVEQDPNQLTRGSNMQ